MGNKLYGKTRFAVVRWYIKKMLQDGVAVQRFCPKGLFFNRKVQWPGNPCDYASKVQCMTEKAVNREYSNDIHFCRPAIEDYYGQC